MRLAKKIINKDIDSSKESWIESHLAYEITCDDANIRQDFLFHLGSIILSFMALALSLISMFVVW